MLPPCCNTYLKSRAWQVTIWDQTKESLTALRKSSTARTFATCDIAQRLRASAPASVRGCRLMHDEYATHFEATLDGMAGHCASIIGISHPFAGFNSRRASARIVSYPSSRGGRLGRPHSGEGLEQPTMVSLITRLYNALAAGHSMSFSSALRSCLRPSPSALLSSPSLLHPLAIFSDKLFYH